MRSRLLIVVAVIGLAAPLTGIAQSYMSPEQVLEQTDGAFLIPSHNRGSAWQSDLQAQQSIDRHPSMIREPWDTTVDTGIPAPSLPEETAYMEEPLLPAQPVYTGMDPTTARLLARLAQQNSILASTAGQSGAPLAHTGPASTIAVIAMAAAMIWTVRRARVLERFVREF